MEKKNSRKKISVLVTAVGGRSVGYQILECLKKFTDAYRIVATDMDPFSPGLYEADASYTLPSARSSNFIKSLIALAKKEQVDIILPGSQPEVIAVSKHQKTFLKEGIMPLVNPYSVIQKCFDKLVMYEFFKKHNISTPFTIELDSLKEAKKLQYPLIVKPRSESGASRNVHIIKNIDELSIFFHILSKENVKLLVQEYVGSQDAEYTVGVVAGRDGRIIDTIVMRRYLTGISRGEERKIDGKSYVLSTGYSQGFFVEDREVKNYCEYVTKTIGARGPLNIQCRKTKKRIYIFEVHPRFSGSASMRAEVGFNEPHVLIQEFLGIKHPKKISHDLEYAVMRKFSNVVTKMKDYEKFKKQ